MKDKIDQYLDLINDADNVTDATASEAMNDRELAEIHNIVSKAAAASVRQPRPDIDREWQLFADKHTGRGRSKRRGVYRFVVRNIAAVMIGAIAAAAVVAMTIQRTLRQSAKEPVAPYESAEIARHDIAMVEDSVAVPAQAAEGTVVFKNQRLAVILAEMARHYGLAVNFKNNEAKELRLYFQWDKTQSVEETVEQLDSFEQLNVKITDGAIVVE